MLIPFEKEWIQQFPAIDNCLGRLGSLTLESQFIKEKENAKFQSVGFRLKIDLVSHPASGREVG